MPSKAKVNEHPVGLGQAMLNCLGWVRLYEV